MIVSNLEVLCYPFREQLIVLPFISFITSVNMATLLIKVFTILLKKEGFVCIDVENSVMMKNAYVIALGRNYLCDNCNSMNGTIDGVDDEDENVPVTVNIILATFT